MKKILLLLAAFALLIAKPAHARTLTVAWDASPGPDVVGYEIYVFDEPSQTWVMIKEVGEVLKVTLDNFPDAAFRSHVRAVNTSGLRSDPSNEITVPVTVSPPSNYKVTVTVTVEIIEP